MIRIAKILLALCISSGLTAKGLADETDSPAVIAKAENYSLSLLNESRFQAPPGWQWGHFKNTDGAMLRYGWTQSQAAPHGTIVVTPGFIATAETFFETARDFQSHGYDVWILDRRGQGGSDRWLPNREKAYSIGFEHDENDLVQFVTHVVRPRGPVFLAGESLGGHLGLRALHDHPAQLGS